MSAGFDPQRMDHWLLMGTFVALSLSILWAVYGSR
jgi:hypothetical protein